MEESTALLGDSADKGQVKAGSEVEICVLVKRGVLAAEAVDSGE